MVVDVRRETKPFWSVSPTGSLSINLHPGQARVWRSRRRFVAMIAGSQSGKTSFGPLWLWREIQERGDGDYIAATSSFPLLKLKMLPEFLRFFDQTLHLGNWHGSDRVFTYHDGKTRIIFGTASHPESLESATAKGGWLDECGQDDFRLASFEAINRRVTLNMGRLLMTTTPYNLGWLKQQVYDRWRNGDPDYDVIQFESIENPLFPVEEFERLRRTMPSWKFDMFMRGLLSRPAGLIYSDFIDTYREEGGHKVHPFDIPANWPRFGGLDFGAVNTARLMIAQDPATEIYILYSESLDGGKTTAEHAAAALDLVRGTNITGWWGGSGSEDQQRRDWSAAGVKVNEPFLSTKAGTANEGIVEAGIDRVIALFKTRQLYVFDSCIGVLDELGSYARELDPITFEPTKAIKDKASYHRCFAPGTMVSTVAGPVPIERVRVGDYVTTRSGPCRVLAAGLSSAAACTVRVRLSNGAELTGTPNHPVWAPRRGWVRLDALRYGIIVACEQRLSPGTASGSIGTPRAKTDQIACTSVRLRSWRSRVFAISTWPSGRMPTIPCPRVFRCTTATKIHSTMPRIISRHFRQRSMRAGTRPNWRKLGERMPSVSGRSPSRGIAVTRDELGINSTVARRGLIERQCRVVVTSAGASSPALPGDSMIASVPTLVNPLRAVRVELMTKPANARSARHRSLSIATRSSRLVRLPAARVLAVETGPRSPVYNLMVEGAPEFFANGVLVHNCDALRYLVQGIEQPRGSIWFA